MRCYRLLIMNELTALHGILKVIYKGCCGRLFFIGNVRACKLPSSYCPAVKVNKIFAWSSVQEIAKVKQHAHMRDTKRVSTVEAGTRMSIDLFEHAFEYA